MTTPITALVIPADTGAEVYATTIHGLDDLQHLVGGFIEPVTGRGWTAYLDEEGKLKNRQRNDRAHTFMHTISPIGLAPHDVIVGDVVLVGPCDDHGDDTAAPATIAAHFDITPNTQ